jgi:DNA-binding NarL/FixJ family response regulator
MTAAPSALATRILLADDHAVVRRGLRLVLESEPDLRVVAEAGDGSEAVRQAVREDVDLAVLDISMPGMTGIQAAQELTRLRPQLRTLILSMHDNEQYLLEALRAGASGYVLKSAPAEDIAKAVKAVTGGGTFLGGDFAGGKPSEVEKLLELSPRERQILELLAEGLRVKEIAERLQLSPATVHTHVRNAIAKLEVDTRTEAVALAVKFSYLGAGGQA